MDFSADFNTGAYASWGPTVANRVPVHACGPYNMPNYRAVGRAVHTHLVPAGAFRGFGVPQSAIAQEQLLDELAIKLNIDPLEFRILNALDKDDATVTGQMFKDGVGFKPCLEALRPRWREALAEAEAFNSSCERPATAAASASPACGTDAAIPRCRTRRPCGSALKPDGRLTLFQGAVDIGQGSKRW